jgi:hypothetical protein
LEAYDPFRAIKRARKGLGPIAFLVILLFALFIASLGSFVANLLLFQPIEVSDAYWTVSGLRAERARVGEQVTAHVTLYSRGRFEGEILVRVRVDINLWFDKDMATQRFYVASRSGEVREVTLDFKPNRPSAGDINGYFVQVDFGFSGKWTMPNSYPPRLIVTA